MYKFSRFLQSTKAKPLINSTPSGIVISVNLLQSLKENALIKVKPAGSFIAFKFVQPKKTPSPISVTEFEIIMLSRFEHQLKAESPMKMTGKFSIRSGMITDLDEPRYLQILTPESMCLYLNFMMFLRSQYNFAIRIVKRKAPSLGLNGNLKLLSID